MWIDSTVYFTLWCALMMNITLVATECGTTHYDITTNGIWETDPYPSLACQGVPFFPEVEPIKYFRLKSGTPAVIFLTRKPRIYDRYNDVYYQIEIAVNGLITIYRNDGALTPVVSTAPGPNLLSATDFVDLYVSVIKADGTIHLGRASSDGDDADIASWRDANLIDVNYILVQTFDDPDASAAIWEFCDGALKLLSQRAGVSATQRDTDTSLDRDQGNAAQAIDGDGNNGRFNENDCTATNDNAGNEFAWWRIDLQDMYHIKAVSMIDSVIPTPDDQCAKGWRRFGAACYFEGYESITWAAAQTDCLRRGGNLATVSTPEIQDFFEGWLQHTDEPGYWIGLSEDTGTTYTWEDGTPGFSQAPGGSIDEAGYYTNWASSNPSNTGDDCVQLDVTDSFKWNDQLCANSARYICQNTLCNSGWVQFGEYCYQFVDTAGSEASWTDAETACAGKLSGETGIDARGLITVDTIQKQVFLWSIFQFGANVVPTYWIGLNLNDRSTTDEYRWDAGDDPGFDWSGGTVNNGGMVTNGDGYENWAASEPSDPAGAECVAVDDDNIDDLLWYDRPCSNTYFYICQIRYNNDRSTNNNLLNTEVRVGSCDHTTGSSQLAIIKKNEVCEPAINSADSPEDILLDNTGFWILRECDTNYYGQYVYILKEGASGTWFSLCEVEIWGIELSDANKPKVGFTVSSVSDLENDLNTKTVTVSRTDGSVQHPTCLGFELELTDETTGSISGDYSLNPTSILGTDNPPSYQHMLDPDQPTLTFDVTFVEDYCEEPDEIVGFRFSRLSPGLCAGDADPITYDEVKYTILNDDVTYYWEKTALSVLEGTTTMTGTLRRTGYTKQTTTAYITTSDNSATGDKDFTRISASTSESAIEFGIDITSRPVVVTILEDEDCELPPMAGETFDLVISENPDACVVMGGDLTVTILPDDSIFQFQSNSGTSLIPYVISESRTLLVVVERMGYIDRLEYVDVRSQSLLNPSATPGNDYIPISETLMFPVGVRTASVNVTIKHDAIVEEAKEKFSLILIRNPIDLPECVISSTRKEVTVEVADDDCTWRMMVEEMSVYENNGPATVTILCARDDGLVNPYLQRPRTAMLQIDSSRITDGTAATAGGDFTTSSITSVTIPSGDTSKTINLPITNDNLEEGVEYFDVILVSSNDGELAEPLSTRVAINDDDVTVTLATCKDGDITLLESAGVFTVTLERTGDITGSDRVLLFTNPQTATAGSATGEGDYVSFNEVVPFATMDSSESRNIIINTDMEYENDETFVVELQKKNADTNVDTSVARCVVTIQDDDCVISISPTNGNRIVSESVGIILFTVTRSGYKSTAATVRISTSSLNDPLTQSDAEPGQDYAVTSTLVVFEPGIPTQTVDIPIIDDSILEGDEYFAVTLSDNDCITSGENTLVIGIKDNDEVKVAMEDESVTVNENDGFVFATVIRTGSVMTRTDTVTLSVSPRAVGGISSAATVGRDFVNDEIIVTFDPGEKRKEIQVPIVDDDVEEPGLESFVIKIVKVTQNQGGALTTTGATIDNANRETLVYIRDDDGGFNLRSLERYSEGVGNIPITMDRTGPATTEEIVYLSTKDIGATSADYQPLNAAPLRFPVGISTASLNVIVLQDNILEPSEDFLVCWSMESDRRFEECVEIVSIVDDDNEVKFVTTPGSVAGENSIAVSESDETALLTLQRSGYGSSYPTGTTTVSIEAREITGFLANGLMPADGNGVDFSYSGQTITFSNGQTRAELEIDIIDDGIAENQELFDVVLTDVSPDGNNMIVYPSRVTVYIIDDDDDGSSRPPGGDGDGDTGAGGGVSQLFIIIVGGVAGLVVLLGVLGALGCVILARLRQRGAQQFPAPQPQSRTPRGPPPGYYDQGPGINAYQPPQSQFGQPRPLRY